MFDAGMTEQDICDIENLSNEAVRNAAKLTKHCRSFDAVLDVVSYTDRNKAKRVARYFRAQATLLEEELAARPSPSKPVAQPCVHNYVMDVCLYCCATKPVQPITDYANLPTH